MNGDVTGLPASSPAPAAAPGAPGGGGAPNPEQAPQYITRDEAQRLAEAAADAAFRKAQGLTDKTASRLEKQVQDRLAEIEKFVGPLTEEQKAKMANSLTQQEAAPATNPQAATPVAVMDQAEIDRRTSEIYQKHGLELEDTDPEARLVDGVKSPEAWLAALETATAQKAARLKTPAQARVAAFGGGAAANPVMTTNDPDQLWKLARERGSTPRKG